MPQIFELSSKIILMEGTLMGFSGEMCLCDLLLWKGELPSSRPGISSLFCWPCSVTWRWETQVAATLWEEVQSKIGFNSSFDPTSLQLLVKPVVFTGLWTSQYHTRDQELTHCHPRAIFLPLVPFVTRHQRSHPIPNAYNYLTLPSSPRSPGYWSTLDD